MKNLTLIVWITQLGLSVALPLAGFVLLGVWLHNTCGWGLWTVFAGVVIGMICAFEGLQSALKTMKRLSDDPKQDKPPTAFNNHD